MNLYIDMGGTNFRYQLDQEKIISYKTKDIKLLQFIKNMIKEYPIKKIAISFAGQVNNGAILSSPNIDIKNINIKKTIEDKYPVTLEIENDLNCAALYENSIYKKYNTLAVFYIGTGFGGAFIHNNKLINGKNNLAGEIGHIPYQPTPFRCSCGKDNCLELVTSGKALKLWSEHLNLKEKNITLKKLQNGKNHTIYTNFIKGLHHAISTVTTLFDPDIFIFGGSVMNNNPQLLTILEKEFKKIPFNTIRKIPKLVLSKNKNGSLEGAKLLFGG